MTRAISLLFHDVYVDDPADSGFVSEAADRYKLRLAEFEAQLEGVGTIRSDAPLLATSLLDGRGESGGGGDGSTQRAQRREDRREALASSALPAFGRQYGSRGQPDHKHLDVARACDPARLAIHAARSAGADDASASAISAPQRSLRLPSSLRSLPSRRPHQPWVLTFDDGGVSYHTLIADRLEARGWRGHCFVTTDCIGRRGFLDPAQIRDLDARGHVIGSHSASHPTRFSACSYTQMVAEWRQSRQALEDLLGHAVQAASVPGGYFSPDVARAAREAGLTALFTSEPVTSIAIDAGLTLIGRFTIRRGDATETAMRLVLHAPWARVAAWTSWNAKGLIKPLLGPSYMRIADWLLAARRPAPASLAAGELRRGRSS